jgi:ADP-ribose pyrophosphatase YjhB (NUDIX family)
MAKVQRLMCAATYVFNENNQFLLLFHKKLKQWVPPGGKIGRYETPETASIRENFEETGLKIELISPAKTPANIISPFGIHVNPIEAGSLEHIDLIYLARSNSSAFQLDETESTKAQ